MKRPFKILGINGSPRKANTDILLDQALAAARSASPEGVIDTEVIYLRNEDIRYCVGCFRCNEANDHVSGCQVHLDAMERLTPILREVDGIIVASPVYFGGVTAQVKTFMDRTQSFLRYTPAPRTAMFRNKIGAAIAVGGNRNGGQEATIQGIHHFFMIHDMIVVGTGPDMQPGCYLGAGAFSGADPKRGSRVTAAVEADEVGMRAAKIIGKRVAEMLILLGGKTGRPELLPQQSSVYAQ
jgi:multimeric flavodoxin WrbA